MQFKFIYYSIIIKNLIIIEKTKTEISFNL